MNRRYKGQETIFDLIELSEKKGNVIPPKPNDTPVEFMRRKFEDNADDEEYDEYDYGDEDDPDEKRKVRLNLD